MVWLKLGGDKGGKTFKQMFQVANVKHPNIPRHTVVVCASEATDNEAKHGCDMGSRYMNDKECHNFIMAIGETLIDDLKESLLHRPMYCSILFDGSSDKTLFENEAVTVKLVHNGEPTFKLVGITHPSSSKAVDAHEAVTTKCKEMGLDLSKFCVAAAAEGASVNFGL